MDTDDPGVDLPGLPGMFSRAAATYDRVGVDFFGPIARALVARLAPGSGERVLDVGCGRGAVLELAAEAVGPGGAVLGIDIAPAMVSRTRADLAARGRRNTEVQVMDASSPPLPPATYDVVASSLVLFFLPDPDAALVAWRSLLVPGGRVGVTTFAEQDPAWRHVDEVFAPWLPPRLRDARTSGTQGPFASDAGMEALVHQAGFGDLRTTTVRVEIELADVGQWHDFTWSVGQRAMWEAVPVEQRQTVLADAEQRLELARGGDGRIVLGQQVRITTGVRPA